MKENEIFSYLPLNSHHSRGRTLPREELPGQHVRLIQTTHGPLRPLSRVNGDGGFPPNCQHPQAFQRLAPMLVHKPAEPSLHSRYPPQTEQSRPSVLTVSLTLALVLSCAAEQTVPNGFTRPRFVVRN